MGRVPLFLPLVALISGILWGNGDLISPMWMLLLILLAACFLFVRKHAVSIFMLFMAVGWTLTVIHAPRTAFTFLPDAVVSAVVLDIKEESGSRMLLCKIDSLNETPCRSIHAGIRLYGAFPVLSGGERIKFTADIGPYVPPRHVVPDEVIYDGIMQSVEAVASVTGSQLKVIDRDSSLAAALRSNIVSLIVGSGINDETGRMLSALVVGDTGMIDRDTRSEYSLAGLSHILALSGLHVGVIAMIVAVALWPLYIGRHNRTRFAVTIVILWIYAWFTGFIPSVTRAVIMASVYMFGAILERKPVALNSLCLAAIIILSVDPSCLWDIGFQLSFTAVAGIILFYPLLNRVDRKTHPYLYYAMSFPAVSLSAMILTGIPAAYYFHTFPLLFIMSNVAVSLVIPWFIALGVLLIILESAGIHALWLCDMLDLLAAYSDAVAHSVASLKYGAVSDIYFPAWWLVPVMTALLLLAYAGHRRRWPVALIAMLCLVDSLIMIRLFAPSYPAQENYLVADAGCTDFIVRDRNKIYVYTTAVTPAGRNDVIDRISARLKDYMALRSADTVVLLSDTFFSPYVSCRGNYLSVDGNRYCFVSDNHQRPAMEVDYLVICRGFTGNAVECYNAFSPDSVILSADIDPRRLRRYAGELTRRSVPHRILCR